MFDFYYGTRDEIAADERRYLLFIKRMLPRWCNSIPDSEYLALHDTLQLLPAAGGPPVLVETGVGASTIVLLHHAMKHGGRLFSWDLSGLKGAFLRAVCTDTLGAHHRRVLQDHWTFVAYDSLSPYLGIPILRELEAAVDLAFFDSEHTRRQLLGEVAAVNPFLREGGIVAIDDANYAYAHTNVAYINMLRRKLDLPAVDGPPDNACQPFYVEVEQFLRERWATVEYLADTYKPAYRQDLFWAYYASDREAMGKAGMEKTDALEHRYDSWRIAGRRR